MPLAPAAGPRRPRAPTARQWSAKPACPAAAASVTIAYVQSWLATSASATEQPPGPGEPARGEEDAEPRRARGPARLSVTSASSSSGTKERAAAAKSQADAPRAGQVEVDERDRPPVAEHHVGRVDVVVADQAGAVAGRDRPRPGVAGRVEGGHRPVVAAQQVGDADQGLVGEHVLGERRDRRPARDVGERLGHRAGARAPGARRRSRPRPGGRAARGWRASRARPAAPRCRRPGRPGPGWRCRRTAAGRRQRRRVAAGDRHVSAASGTAAVRKARAGLGRGSVCVTRPWTSPPRIAARTAGLLAAS